MLDIGSCYRKLYICSLWGILCFIGLRPLGEVKVLYCLLMYDMMRISLYLFIIAIMTYIRSDQ